MIRQWTKENHTSIHDAVLAKWIWKKKTDTGTNIISYSETEILPRQRSNSAGRQIYAGYYRLTHPSEYGGACDCSGNNNDRNLGFAPHGAGRNFNEASTKNTGT